MSEIINSAINYHAYNMRTDDSLISQVSKIICVLFPRGLSVAGFNAEGELLVIRYGDYNKTLPAWIHDFYEHRFTDEPLLANPEKVVATFIASDKNMLVPQTLFDDLESEKWMNKIFFVEGNEVVTTDKIIGEHAKYMFAYPGTVKSIIARHFSNSRLLPIAAYQFEKPIETPHKLAAIITPENVYATLYKDQILHWHQAFYYEHGEDIAYQLKLACQQHSINENDLAIRVSVAYRGLNPVLNNLSQYFPTINANEERLANSGDWAATISLFQQLYSCVL